MKNPFVAIDLAYHREVEQAIADHSAVPEDFNNALAKIEKRRETKKLKAQLAYDAFVERVHEQH